MPYSPFQSIPLAVRPQVAQLAAEVIEQAASHGQDYWGLTPYSDAIRVNVGWTEILTALPEHMRLIVDGKLAGEAGALSGVTLTSGKDTRGFYPTVPGSVCAEIPYLPATLFEFAISALRPALSKSVQLAARRRAGQGVKAGHNQEALQALASLVGRQLPSPGYELVSVSGSSSPSLPDIDVPVTVNEGARRLVSHLQRERKRTVVEAKKAAVLSSTGCLSCEVCGFDFSAIYGSLGDGFCEVHHLSPLSASDESVTTTLADLAILCSNCHRIIHRSNPMLSVAELSAVVRNGHPKPGVQPGRCAIKPDSAG